MAQRCSEESRIQGRWTEPWAESGTGRSRIPPSGARCRVIRGGGRSRLRAQGAAAAACLAEEPGGAVADSGQRARHAMCRMDAHRTALFPLMYSL